MWPAMALAYGQVNASCFGVRFRRSKLIGWPVKDWSAGLLFVQCSQDGAWPTSKRLCQPKCLDQNRPLNSLLNDTEASSPLT